MTQPTITTPRLSQILSIERNSKTKFETNLSAFYFQTQKADLFYGHVKTHSPKGDSDEQRPTETKQVQGRAKESLLLLKEDFGKFFNLLAQKEGTSCDAKADILVGGSLWRKDVPVMTLVSMEKQLSAQIIQLISKLPILSTDEHWEWDPNKGLFVTQPKETFSKRLEKVPLTLALATEKHPAQVQVIEKEIQTGTWTHVSFSGALPKEDVDRYMRQSVVLLEATKFARQMAATTPVRESDLGTQMMNFIFG